MSSDGDDVKKYEQIDKEILGVLKNPDDAKINEIITTILNDSDFDIVSGAGWRNSFQGAKTYFENKGKLSDGYHKGSLNHLEVFHKNLYNQKILEH